MTEIQGESILVRVSARFELSGVDCSSVCPLFHSVPEKPFLLSWKNFSNLKDYSDQIDYMETFKTGVTSIDLRVGFDKALRLTCSSESCFHKDL